MSEKGFVQHDGEAEQSVCVLFSAELWVCVFVCVWVRVCVSETPPTL